MTLATDWEVEQTWGSHQPLLAGVLEVLKPLSAIECGCGKFSTLRLRDAVPGELITIEHDSPWAKRMLNQLSPSNRSHQWIIHPFNANNATPYPDLKPAEAAALERFYEDQGRALPPVDLLFVDTYRCARVMAARILSHLASMIILHDVEPASIPFYGYQQLEPVMKGWAKYVHRPACIVAKTHGVAWTALYTRKELTPEQLERMQVPIVRESLRLWNLPVRLERDDG